MSWGKGWEVGVRKAIWEQDRVSRQAAGILAAEHGTKHQPGERPDLCPKCRASGAPEEKQA